MNIKRAEYAFQNDSILFPFPGASQEMCKIPIVILLSLQPNYWCGGHPAFWASRLFWFGSRQLRGNWFLAWIGILIIISWLSEEMCVLLRWMFEIMDILKADVRKLDVSSSNRLSTLCCAREGRTWASAQAKIFVAIFALTARLQTSATLCCPLLFPA